MGVGGCLTSEERKRFTGSTFLRFVDAEKYMATVASALLIAKDEIFITDWM